MRDDCKRQKKKTLVKAKIVIDDQGLVTYMWKRSWKLWFGKWYPFGTITGDISDTQKVLINDNNVSDVLFRNFIQGNYDTGKNSFKQD